MDRDTFLRELRERRAAASRDPDDVAARIDECRALGAILTDRARNPKLYRPSKADQARQLADVLGMKDELMLWGPDRFMAYARRSEDWAPTPQSPDNPPEPAVAYKARRPKNAKERRALRREWERLARQKAART